MVRQEVVQKRKNKCDRKTQEQESNENVVGHRNMMNGQKRMRQDMGDMQQWI